MLPLLGVGIVGLVVGGILLHRQMRERDYYSAFERESSSGGADIGYASQPLQFSKDQTFSSHGVKLTALKHQVPGSQR